MANNSSGARSVLYGKTIDHVLEQVVALSDGSVAHFREIPRNDVPTGDTLEAACYRTVLRLAAEHADEIDRRYPKILRRVGGYNLDEFTDPARPVNLAKIMVGSEGTLGDRARSQAAPGAAAEGEGRDGDHVRRPAGSAGRRARDPAPQAFGGRGDGQIHSRQHPPERGAGPHPQQRSSRAIRRATLCVEFYADRKEDLPPRLAALEAGSARARSGLRLSFRNRPRGVRRASGACAKRRSGFRWR